MVVQYNHIATIETPGTDSYLDANGNWVAGTPGNTVVLKCRAESATGNGYLKGVDGTKIDYSWIVYFQIAGTDFFSYVSPGSIEKVSDLEITINADEAGDYTVLRPELAGKTYSLQRRGVGVLKSSEFTILSNGFRLANTLDLLQAGEFFVATINNVVPTGTLVTVSGGKIGQIKTGSKVTVSGSDGNGGAEVILTDTVKRFSCGQLNARVWL